MIRERVRWLTYFLILSLFLAAPGYSQTKNPEWDKIVEAAKKEGKIVASIPPTP